jgi:hypothetical protein
MQITEEITEKSAEIDVAGKFDQKFLRDIEERIHESIEKFIEYSSKDFELNLFLASLTFPTTLTQTTFTGSGPLLLFDLFHKWNFRKQQGIEGLEFFPTFRTPQQFLMNLNCKIPAAFYLVRFGRLFLLPLTS